MPAIQEDITIEQGATWARGWLVRVNGVLIDATWTAKGQVRQTVDAETPLHEFAAAVNPDGSVVIGVTPAESRAWAWREGRYDVEVTNADASLELRVAQGTASVSAEVTR